MARYIDADKLDVVIFQDKSKEFIDGAMAVLEMIDEIPTEQVQPIVRGKWLNVSKSVCDDYLGDVNYAECSVCHSIRVADYFCSCCGADMRKMEESEENNE